MKLLTKALATKLAKSNAGRKNIENIMVYGKLFNPCGAATWYLYDYDAGTRTLWAFVTLGDPQCAELGPVSLDELESLRCPPFGLPIERDRHFDAQPLQGIMDTIRSGGHV